MSRDAQMREISEFDLATFSELGVETHRRIGVDRQPFRDRPPYDLDEAARAKWEAEQEQQEAKWKEEEKQRLEEAERRRNEALAKFKAALEDRLTKEYAAGAAYAVSREASRAISVRSYVLLGVVAAVVAMPLIAMFFKLDPQAFGAYIAPVTGITGTIVGYWFGTVGQATTGQGTIQPSRRRTPTT